MSTPTRTTSVTDRIFDSWIERQATLFDVVRGSNDRINRFNHSMLEGARQGSREWAEVGRRFAHNPTDLVSVYEAMSEAMGNAQARGLALVREWADDAVQAQRETRDALSQGLGDVREVVQANGATIFRRGGTNGDKAERASSKP
ncbi:MAG TPA: hypothetical protein VMR52_04420 [Dehalococcoidia bacterium]|nr:hypothetical protein [Dehalococcoidia bacterium]